MALIEDDTILHPDIDADSLLFITSLNEDHSVYTRFFDALLIERRQHRSFFRDLKAFRQQPRVIVVLDRARVDKTRYKDVTLEFLGSRFAHPWCRKSGLKKGFWRAEWGTIDGKKKDVETAQEEQRLHKLLVPLWVIMASKMFPGEDNVREWCAEERSRSKNTATSRVTTSTLNKQEKGPENNPTRRAHAYSGLGDKAQWADEDEAEEEEPQMAAHAATSVFRLAAAGIILSQTPKRKLRWLTKKS